MPPTQRQRLKQRQRRRQLHQGVTVVGHVVLLGGGLPTSRGGLPKKMPLDHRRLPLQQRLQLQQFLEQRLKQRQRRASSARGGLPNRPLDQRRLPLQQQRPQLLQQLKDQRRQLVHEDGARGPIRQPHHHRLLIGMWSCSSWSWTNWIQTSTPLMEPGQPRRRAGVALPTSSN